MKTEYRITIGQKGGRSYATRPPSKVEIVKAAVLTLLALAMVVGICLAALVVGSVIATVLLMLLAVSILVWLIRWLLSELKRRVAAE